MYRIKEKMYYTVGEIAEKTGLSRQGVYFRYRHKVGDLGFVKIDRQFHKQLLVAEEDLPKWFDEDGNAKRWQRE